MKKKIIPAAALLFIGLTTIAAFLGWRAKIEVEGVAVEQFNRQQLILAEKIARDIEEHFDFLRSCLRSLAKVWERSSDDPVRRDRSMAAFQEILRQSEALATGFAARDGGFFLFAEDGRMLPIPELACGDCPDPRQARPDEPSVRISPVFVPDAGPFTGRMVMILSKGVSGNGQEGGLFFVIDPEALARQYAHGVISGQTGYAWVIDSNTIILDHFEEEFIGRPSLEARRNRNPDISWNKLSWLVTERIARGERGEDWYYSGWHRGLRGEIKKYISYCPAYLSAQGAKGPFWAVAVVAPETEVQGVIGRLLTKELAILFFFEAVVALFFVIGLILSVRWSESLRAKVDEKANELLGAQKKLLRSERFAAIGQAAAHLSHEIKNPLMLMGGFAGQVRKTLPSGKEADKLRIIEEEARRLESMLTEVRDFTRPNPPHKTGGDLNVLVEETLGLMGERLSSSGVTVVRELDPKTGSLPFDHGQIKQVLINLMKNAMEAMENGGRLTVSTRSGPDGVRLTVKDSGPGIPEDMRQRIFEPFCTTKESGTGLGLSVCARIAEDHGGELVCESAPGEGAAFSLFLPREGGAA